MPRKITQKTRRVAVVRRKNGKTPVSKPKTAKTTKKREILQKRRRL